MIQDHAIPRIICTHQGTHGRRHAIDMPSTCRSGMASLATYGLTNPFRTHVLDQGTQAMLSGDMLHIYFCW